MRFLNTDFIVGAMPCARPIKGKTYNLGNHKGLPLQRFRQNKKRPLLSESQLGFPMEDF